MTCALAFVHYLLSVGLGVLNMQETLLSMLTFVETEIKMKLLLQKAEGNLNSCFIT